MNKVWLFAVAGIGGLKNEAQRNVKLDHLQTLPNEIKKITFDTNTKPPQHFVGSSFVPR